MEKAAQVIRVLITVKSLETIKEFKRCGARVRARIYDVLAKIRAVLNKIRQTVTNILNAIVEFIKKAGVVILTILALLYFIGVGDPSFYYSLA